MLLKSPIVALWKVVRLNLRTAHNLRTVSAKLTLLKQTHNLCFVTIIENWIKPNTVRVLDRKLVCNYNKKNDITVLARQIFPNDAYSHRIDVTYRLQCAEMFSLKVK